MQFEAYPGGRQTKENIDTPNSRKQLSMCKRTRKELRMLTQIITGHSWLNKHMHTIKVSKTPLCPLCKEEEETTTHFIYECPELDDLRRTIYGTQIITETHNPIKYMDFNKLVT